MRRHLDDGEGGILPVLAAGPTHPDLVRAVGTWKYHGVRGLAWPLARLLVPVWACWTRGPERPPGLVPVPLHRRRRRERGFDQCALLARLLASETGAQADESRLARIRPTAQQARLQEDDERRQNLAGVFAACAPARPDPDPVVLLDDLVTSGATVTAAARALRQRGWPVAGVLALGVAMHRSGESEGPIDAPG